MARNKPLTTMEAFLAKMQIMEELGQNPGDGLTEQQWARDAAATRGGINADNIRQYYDATFVPVPGGQQDPYRIGLKGNNYNPAQLMIDPSYIRSKQNEEKVNALLEEAAKAKDKEYTTNSNPDNKVHEWAPGANPNQPETPEEVDPRDGMMIGYSTAIPKSNISVTPNKTDMKKGGTNQYKASNIMNKNVLNIK